MRVLGWLIVGAFILTGVRLGIQLLVLAMIATTVIALIAAPKETLSILLALLVLQAFAAHPLAGLLAVIFFVACGRVARR